MKPAAGDEQRTPKYRQILDHLRSRIRTGEYQSGDRLPSESELVRQFQTSRLTVGRALKELQLEGFAVRRAGSGSYALVPEPVKGHVFGLLIPDLGRTEIFEPICQGMMDARHAGNHSLLWGNSFTEGGRQEEQAEQLCRKYIEQGVSGVFFAPLEFSEARDELNRGIARELDRAGIPMVLLDRCIEPYPRRSRYDLIGIDNRRAGFALTEHFLALGARRVAFIARPYSAPTVDARIAGYREALYTAGIDVNTALVQRIDAGDLPAVRSLLDSERPDAIICANDNTAALLMRTLHALEFEIPRHVRIGAFDDVRYASLLQVPLTTVHQPCNAMGAAALSAMLDRMEHPGAPPKDILLDFKLIVRQSCGSGTKVSAPFG